MSRRKRPSSTTSVTPPLSASSRSLRAPSDLLHQALEIGAGQQGAGQMTQPLQLPVAPVGLLQRTLQRLLLGFGQLLQVAEGDQRQKGGDGGEQQPDSVVLAEEPEPQPGDDDGDADDGAGVGQTAPATLQLGGDPAGRGEASGVQASAVRISWNSVSPVRSIRLR